MLAVNFSLNHSHLFCLSVIFSLRGSKMNENVEEKRIQSFRMMLDYNRKLNCSRQALNNALEALEENPGCGDLRCEVSRLQDDVSRLTSDRDQEKQRFNDLSFEFTKARDLLFDSVERISHAKHHVKSVSTESQCQECPGMCMPTSKEKFFTGFQFGDGMSGVYRYIASCFLPNAEQSYKKIV
jgi:hypothetical protein